MPDYKQGKIYKIESDKGNKIYVGSTTTEYLSQRMRSHKYDYDALKRDPTRGKTKSFDLFDEYGFDNCRIILIENCPCDSIDQLKAREAYYIKSLECINRNIPQRLIKQYRIDNRDKLLKQMKEYRENNKEKSNVKYNCECGSQYTHRHKADHFKTKKHQSFINNN